MRGFVRGRRKVFLAGGGGTDFSDLWSFFVEKIFQPVGSLTYLLFCCNSFGWGWEQFKAEANAGEGAKVQDWMKFLFRYVSPVVVAFLLIYGLATFSFHG